MRGDHDEARRLLETIAATPRAAGSPEEKRAREFCANYLRDQGYRIREEPFTYSAFAGRLATPLAGIILVSLFTLIFFLASDFSGTSSTSTERIAIVVLIHLFLLLIVALVSTPRAILSFPAMRRESANLVAAHGGDGEPDLWLVAHLDTKSQTVSILMRAIAIAMSALSLLTVVLLGGLGLIAGFAVHPLLWLLLGLWGVFGAIPIALSFVSNASSGALDNASGVVAVMLAAADLSRSGETGVGVVLTSGEELGLAGAHAWAERRTEAPRLAINCDSVDDVGKYLLLGGPVGSFAHRNLKVGRKDGMAFGGRAMEALRVAVQASETPFLERRRLPGILVDSIALEARGWDTVTLCRGSVASLGRIHTPRDTPGALRGLGAAQAAIVIRDASSAILRRVQ